MTDGVAPACNILTSDGWKLFKDVSVGDIVYDSEGSRVEVTSLDSNFCTNYPLYQIITKSGRRIVLGFDQIISIVKNGNKVLSSVRDILHSLGGVGVNKWQITVEPLSALIAFNDSQAVLKPHDIVYSDGIVSLSKFITSAALSITTTSKDGIVLVGTGMFPLFFRSIS